ncbi:MAG: trehalose-phosphatase [Candidatus Acidoferrum typicum]|nr:trehalose-phosphatase [Candidatus Acidoferrum typicum]
MQGKPREIGPRQPVPFAVTQPQNSVPNILDCGGKCWEPLSRRIKAASSIWIFLDFDGTLVGYYDRPEDVKLGRECLRILERLSRHRRVHLAIVSGRRNAALREHFQIPRVKLLGLFGWEKSGRRPLSPRIKAAIRGLRPALAQLPKLFPGVLLENKGISYAVHFRGMPAGAQRRVQAWVRRLVARMGPDFSVIQSNHSSEIVPRQVQGKGVAMREFARSLRSPFFPIYVGDDLTDEPAFVALRRGITVRVGDFSRTKARFRLRNPEEVCTFLERIEGELS